MDLRALMIHSSCGITEQIKHIELDVYDLCTDELKARLQPARQMIDDIEEKKKSTLTQANNENSKDAPDPAISGIDEIKG
ncbi:hypothetical protein M514_04250 [Trichuris suis]|uniref:Uncharacterized protein n=1 Tax=Trichuris suis TaxID=68888 RepID=A0A085NQE2_9BILA|nr:hypothetical protein M513_04250 [Trichuris suis]KFD71688.1 hypothetical protein M514_04250 [Trichuris suis]